MTVALIIIVAYIVSVAIVLAFGLYGVASTKSHGFANAVLFALLWPYFWWRDHTKGF